jgi:Holliday junction resolvase-like predicted endonuclease
VAKQQRLVRAARDFLARWRGPPRDLRFDVIAVVDAPAGPRLSHFPGAFDAAE